MIVCQCTGITDRQIRREADQGATTSDEVGVRCGAGACCGGCLPTLRALLGEDATLPASCPALLVAAH